MVVGYARTLLRENVADLDSVVAEACLAAQENFEEFDPEVVSFAVWIRALVRFKALDSLINLGLRPTYSLEGFADGVDAVFAEFDEMDDVRYNWPAQAGRLWSRALNLKGAVKSVLINFYHRNLSLEEVSAKTRNKEEVCLERIREAHEELLEDLPGQEAAGHE